MGSASTWTANTVPSPSAPAMGVPEDEKHAILAGNCVRVYRIGEGE